MLRALGRGDGERPDQGLPGADLELEADPQDRIGLRLTRAMHAAQWLRSFPLPVDGEIRLVTVLTPVEELTRTSRLLPLPLMSHEDAEAFADQQRRDAE